MKFNILTIFPQIFENFNIFEGVVKKAILNNLISVNIIDLKKFKTNNKVDDKVYGSEHGQLIKVDVLDNALKSINSIPNYSSFDQKRLIIYMSPRGEKLSYKNINDFLKYEEITIICGRYEGIDHRIIDKYLIKEVSIGDFVLSNGDIAAAVFIDVLSRYIPNIIKNIDSINIESFSDKIDFKKEYPQFSLPPTWENKKVPDIFLSGNHKKIKDFQEKLSIDNEYISSYITYDIDELSNISNYIIYNILKNKYYPKIFIYGTLGAGKTTLIKNILSYFTDDEILSPTYSIINTYFNKKNNEKIYHIDLYRINHIDELYQIELDNILSSKNLVIIEWPEKIPKEFLKYIENSNIFKINIKYIDENTRQYNFNF